MITVSSALKRTAILVVALLAVSSHPNPLEAEGRSNLVNIRSADPEMNAAIARARASLPKFWASYEGHNPSERGHSLKVRFANPVDNGEHIWMSDVQKRPDNSYSGRFANTPEHLAGKRMGDVAEFKDADISDWMFVRNGKIVGGETIRVMLTHMPTADADALRAKLETP